MIVVKSKYHIRKYCYGGSGILDILKHVIRKTAPAVIAQKVVNATTKEGIKRVINKVGNSTITHKVVDAVVNGATLATQKAVENAVTDILTKRKEPVKKLKRKFPEISAATTNKDKKIKIDVANLINSSSSGSGIVLD